MIAIYTFFPYAIEQYRKHRNLSAKQSLVPRIFMYTIGLGRTSEGESESELNNGKKRPCGMLYYWFSSIICSLHNRTTVELPYKNVAKMWKQAQTHTQHRNTSYTGRSGERLYSLYVVVQFILSFMPHKTALQTILGWNVASACFQN